MPSTDTTAVVASAGTARRGYVHAAVLVGVVLGCAAHQVSAQNDSLARSRDTLAPHGDTASAGPRPLAHTDTGRLRICAGGDITLGTNLDTLWMRRASRRGGDLTAATSWAGLLAPDSLVAPLRSLMSGAEVILVNAEGAIGDDTAATDKCVPGHMQCFALRSPAAAAPALRAIGDSATVVVANVANNHAHDAGDEGFRTTTMLLERAGVLVTGADTMPTIAVTAAGDTVAILGFSAWTTPGVDDLDVVTRLVGRAVAAYRRVVVTAHLGAEGRFAQRTADSLEQFAGERRGNAVAFAHAAVDAGAGLVVAHGPHVLRAAEWRGDALIFYSLGNLINYGPFGLGEPMARGAVACATLDSAGHPRDVILRPTRQPDPGVVRPDASRRALALVDSLSHLDFPTTGARVDRVTGAVTRRPPRDLRRGRVSRRRSGSRRSSAPP